MSAVRGMGALLQHGNAVPAVGVALKLPLDPLVAQDAPYLLQLISGLVRPGAKGRSRVAGEQGGLRPCRMR